MMADNEKLTPEEKDVRNQAMLQDLCYMHASGTTSQSLKRVRDRLLVAQRSSISSSRQTSPQFTHKIKQGRIQSMHAISISIARKKGKYLNILAAGVIAALLIGSLLFVVTHVYQSNTGSGGPTKHMPAAGPKPTPVPTCNSGSNSAPTPIPTALPTGVPAPTPTALPTCIPVVAPTPTPTGAPVATTTPLPTSAPIATPLPTGAPAPTPTALPTGVPAPTPTALPTGVPAPTPTPPSTGVPAPTPTLVPSH